MTYSDQRNQGQRPLPDYIYRRRRIAALVLLVVLIAAIALIVRCAVGGDEVAPTGQSTGTSASAAQSPTEAITEERPTGSDVTKAPAAAPPPTTLAPYQVPTPPPAEVDKDTCALGDLQLTVQSDQPTYGPDAAPTFTLTLRNPTRADCAVNLEENKVRFEVYTLGDYARVWSDTDCHASEGQGTATIKPGETASWSLNWSRLASAPGTCSEADRKPAAPGPYLLYGLVGPRNSEGQTFNLR